MGNLWFQNRNNKRYLIANVETFKDVFRSINEFIDQCNENRPKEKQFKSYYTRIYTSEGLTELDVGSWSEFFYTDLKYNGDVNNE